MYFYLLILKKYCFIPCFAHLAIPVPLFKTRVVFFFAKYFLVFSRRAILFLQLAKSVVHFCELLNH